VWVVWTLGTLFESALATDLTFKGDFLEFTLVRLAGAVQKKTSLEI
jgi:hypothetical protein